MKSSGLYTGTVPMELVQFESNMFYVLPFYVMWRLYYIFIITLCDQNHLKYKTILHKGTWEPSFYAGIWTMNQSIWVHLKFAQSEFPYLE